HADWDALHQEACEEASLLMVHHALQGHTAAVAASDAERDLQALVAWQQRNGFFDDVSIAELATIAQRYYGHSAHIEDDVSIERIKQILASGRLIIVPAAGRDLGNPYFSGEGPWYHMLVIRGYDRNEFIVNDPGTRRGEAFKYPYDTLIDAIHDWTGVKENIRSGAKRMLILER
ncbi:MAG: C39 family peptidase, partial [Deltaproteobacteria bacterium]|nr:C39 family peptidase [Deltaproteobacteria bacterium]